MDHHGGKISTFLKGQNWPQCPAWNMNTEFKNEVGLPEAKFQHLKLSKESISCHLMHFPAFVPEAYKRRCLTYFCILRNEQLLDERAIINWPRKLLHNETFLSSVDNLLVVGSCHPKTKVRFSYNKRHSHLHQCFLAFIFQRKTPTTTVVSQAKIRLKYQFLHFYEI